MTTKQFLFELGCEELPARMQEPMIKDLVDGFLEACRKRNLNINAGELAEFVTPRRLAFCVTLPEKQQDQTTPMFGPPKSAAFDTEGKPNKAAEAFAAKNGVSVADLCIELDKNVEKLFINKVVVGRMTVELLPEMVAEAVKNIKLAKPMRWGAQAYSFIRPVHWLVALFDEQIVPVEMFGLQAARSTFGHRFHDTQPHRLAHASEYRETLRGGHVIADRNERKSIIQQCVSDTALKSNAVSVFGQSGFDGESWDRLLDEVVGLVEWPVAIMGEFEQKFLAVPQECLISTMRDNQRYFHLVDAHGKLMNRFIIISNIESKNPQSIAEGNAKVIRPRFADAAFFFEQDKKKKLDDRRSSLTNVVFQQQLGTLAEKSARVADLGEAIARELQFNAMQVRRAAELCKCDLLSLMVNEFPELQGVMGQYYALHDGENVEVAHALREYYLPRFAGDELPKSNTGIALAIADRIDTLVGIFAIGQGPSGAKDPFALRRAAIGLLRLIVDKQLDLDLRSVVQYAIGLLGTRVSNAKTESEVMEFIFNRCRANYQDAGVATEIVNAVMAQNPTRPLDFDKRVRAVQHFVGLPESTALAAANKRVRNILAKSDVSVDTTINDGALIEKAEQDLARALSNAQILTAPLLARGDYTAVLVQLAALRPPVDAFFEQVMVNSPHEEVRRNRLALLQKLLALFTAVADIAQLPG